MDLGSSGEPIGSPLDNNLSVFVEQISYPPHPRPFPAGSEGSLFSPTAIATTFFARSPSQKSEADSPTRVRRGTRGGVNPSILFSAGGTGGGVYPAVAVAEALHRLAPTLPLHFVGAVGGMEAGLVPADLFDATHRVQSGPLNGVGVRRATISMLKILVGTFQAWRIVGRLRPSALFLTGGWATFPAALGAWLRRVPIVIFLPDIEPARAIKWISRLSRTILATSADSAAYFPQNAPLIETGYPLRASVENATRSVAIEHFGLDPARQTLLVFGGSRGARSINTVMSAILPKLIIGGLQFIHVTGELDWAAAQERSAGFSEKERQYYHAFPYLHEDMGLALAAADLVVSRAGASVLGEFPRFALPAILIPYPFAWRYQKVNADWLVSRGAAIRLDDESLDHTLLDTIHQLKDDPVRLSAMQAAAKTLAHPDAAAKIAQQLIDLSKV